MFQTWVIKTDQYQRGIRLKRPSHTVLKVTVIKAIGVRCDGNEGH